MGKLTKLSDACAVVKNGETSVMCTVVSKHKPSPSASFLPLSVDYRSKSAAFGHIPTNVRRRDIGEILLFLILSAHSLQFNRLFLGSSEKEILSARLVDRSVRPLFPKNFRCETQLVCNVLSIDSMNKPDVDAINAASAALHISDVPWNGPIGAVRIGIDRHEGEIIVNPTRRELQESPLDIIVAATKQNLVMMLEGKGNIALVQDLQKAIKKGTQEAQHIITQIEKLRASIPIAKPKREVAIELGKGLAVTAEIIDAITTMCQMKIREVFSDSNHDKLSRDNAINAIRQETSDAIWSSYPDYDINQINETFNSIVIKIFRESIFERERRCDGRGFDDLRDIACEVNMYKPLHGSALFTRGQTQVMCTATLGSKDSAIKLDLLSAMEAGVKSRNFFLHYEFPPYATGEIGRIGFVNRREIGHGNLAEKGLAPVIPPNYPFTIHLNSEVLESNGSSSMATVCAGSLALMDAGVPIVAPAAGVAIGLVTKYNADDTKHIEDYRILMDQLGIEDYMGDMDMKIAGTRKGFTSIQTDLKIPGLPLKIVFECIQKAVEAKNRIIDIMSECMSGPRIDKKDSWPVCEKLTIEPHMRAKIIGPNGVNVKKLFLETGVELNAMDETTYEMFAPSQSAMDEAKEFIEGLKAKEKVPDLDFGGIYTAKIVEMRDIGVMVSLYPSMPPALLHNSQLDQRKVGHPSALGLEIGQEIQVKYFGRDPVSGLMRLSRKVLQSPASAIVRNLDRSSSSSASETAKSSTS